MVLCCHVDPVCSNKGIQFSYGGKTSTTTCRVHLDKKHRKLYIKLQTKFGWQSQLPSQVLEAANTLTQAEDGLIDDFNEETFHKYLISFIVADDQVCIVCFKLLDLD